MKFKFFESVNRKEIIRYSVYVIVMILINMLVSMCTNFISSNTVLGFEPKPNALLFSFVANITLAFLIPYVIEYFLIKRFVFQKSFKFRFSEAGLLLLINILRIILFNLILNPFTYVSNIFIIISVLIVLFLFMSTLNYALIKKVFDKKS